MYHRVPFGNSTWLWKIDQCLKKRQIIYKRAIVSIAMWVTRKHQGLPCGVMLHPSQNHGDTRAVSKKKTWGDVEKGLPSSNQR